jgi:hypothetical protein
LDEYAQLTEINDLSGNNECDKIEINTKVIPQTKPAKPIDESTKI